MSCYSERVRAIIEQMPCNSIFVASELRNDKLCDIPEQTYYKALERLVKQNIIVHLTKGLYYRAASNEKGIIPLNKETIIQHYVSEKSGVIIGKGVLSQKGIISNNAEDVEILSSNLKEEKKHIGKIAVQKSTIILDDKTIPVVETLEILQNYNKAEDIDKRRFLSYMKKFSNEYTDDVVRYVIENRKYKKSTIAFLERMLTWYGVENSLNQYLSGLSEYKIPTIQELRIEVPADIKSRLNEYVLELQNIYNQELERVILYGSYARGDFSDDSDIDIMILLHLSDLEIKQYRHQLSELTYDFNMNYQLDIKPIAKNQDDFMKLVDVYPFYANVKREGVELYGVA